MKKIYAFLILNILLLSWVSAWVIAVNYSSTPLEAANSLAERWIINDKSSNPSDYNLYDFVLRQEIAAVSRWVAGLEKKSNCDNIFKDLSSTNPNSWACVNVEVLVDNNLISKNDLFRPEDKITKAESLGMLIKSIGFDYSYDSSNSKTWQEQIVDYAVSKWILDNFTDYDTLATRGWVFLVADTSVKKEEEINIKQKESKIYSDEL